MMAYWNCTFDTMTYQALGMIDIPSSVAHCHLITYGTEKIIGEALSGF
jgi:hypothetical protein